jgi:hypothetical protein
MSSSEEAMRQRVWIVLGLISLLATFACSGMALAAHPDPVVDHAALSAAKERWAEHRPASYRMLLEESNCTTDYQVREELVAWGYEMPCGRHGRTISSLFLLIEEYEQLVPVCVGSNCLCKRVTTLDVRYDVVLGFPREIAIRARLWPNWQNGAFWQAIVATRSNPCNQSGGRMIRVKELVAN